MIEKVSFVRNPLTVIAMFASLAEISGTVVLPLLAENVQSIYVWFLMVFPSVLVILFFLTLFFKHKALYAPSDYKDQTMFADSFKSAPATLMLARQAEEVDQITESEAEAEATNAKGALSHDVSPNTEVVTSSHDQSANLRADLNDYFAAEDFIIRRFEESFGVNFRRNVILDANESHIFDAVAFDEDRCIIVDMKAYISREYEDTRRIRKIKEAQRIILNSKINNKYKVEYIYCFIIREKNFDLYNSLVKYTNDFAGWLLPTKIYIFRMDKTELKKLS